MAEGRKPKIRFKGFTEAWEQRKLGEMADFSKGFGYSKADIKKNGTPLILYGRLYTKYQLVISEVETFAESKTGSVLSKGGEVIVPASGETAEDISIAAVVEKPGVLLGGDLNIITLNSNMDAVFLALTISHGRTHEELSKRAQGKSVVHLHNDDLQTISISLPCLNEQRIVSRYLLYLDHLITLHQRKLEKLKVMKKSMLEKMFPREGTNVPEVRFKGFTEAWEQRKLNDLCHLITKQTGFDYSNTIKSSLVKQKKDDTYSFIQNKDFDGLRINMDTDFYIPVTIANKFPKIVLDSPSLLITISGNIGNVGYYRSSVKAFIGGAVAICKLKEPNGVILNYCLQATSGQAFFHALAKSSSHSNITIEDIRKIQILLPHVKEQKNITRFLEDIDHLITLHQRKLEKLQNIKKSYLENMFV